MAFQDIYFDMYADILPNILSDIYSGILSGIYSGIYSGILSGILSDIYSDILSDILSDISSEILCGQSPAGTTLILHGLAVRVRRVPLRSRVCSWGPAEEEEKKKKNNPHLTCGEKTCYMTRVPLDRAPEGTTWPEL